MKDWYTMQVTEEKIAGTEDHFRFTVGIDTIEMVVSYPTGDYFEDVDIEILNHYIRNRNNKSRNPSRTIALTERIYAHLRIKYLEELKSAFTDIACQPATERLIKRFSCMGHTFFQGSTPEEVLLGSTSIIVALVLLVIFMICSFKFLQLIAFLAKSLHGI